MANPPSRVILDTNLWISYLISRRLIKIDLLNIIDYFAEIVEVHSEVDICRDVKDNFLLALTKDSKADYLVTGDKDLLDLKSFEGTHIVTFAELEIELS